MSERTITADDVEREHQAEVRPGAQAAYLAGVLIVGLIAMLVLIALMGPR